MTTPHVGVRACRQFMQSLLLAAVARLHQFRQDALGQLFAQFHTHLIKGVNVPDDSLGENFMLIQRNQRSQNIWRKFRV